MNPAGTLRSPRFQDVFPGAMHAPAQGMPPDDGNEKALQRRGSSAWTFDPRARARMEG